MGLSKALYISLLTLLILTFAGCSGIVSAAGPNNLTPQLTGLNPTTTRVGSNLTLQVQGNNFTPDSQVIWNGVAKRTTFVSQNLLTASIASTDTSQPTTATVYVTSLKSSDKSNAGHLKVVQSLAITSTVLSPATVGSGYSTTLTASGGKHPYTWGTSSALPPGLTLNSSGTLSGTATAAGMYSFTVTLEDSSTPAQTVSAIVQVTVSSTAAQLTATSATLAGATTGQMYSGSLTASGGSAPYTWTATSTLPPGLSLSSTGTVSGTPTTAGTFTFSAGVRDSSSPPESSTATYKMSVVTAQAPLIVATSSLPAAKSGSSYSASLTASGGMSPYTWSPKTALPTGLVLNSNGLISGTPSVSGTFNVDVKVVDSASPQQSTGATIPLGITSATVSPLLMATPSIPAATVGTPYSVTFSATGGTLPYTWSANSVPAGLTMSASGTLSGTPTTSGTTIVGVNVSDTSNPILHQTSNYKLIVGTTPTTQSLQVTSTTLPGGTVNTGYSALLSASGGTSPYSWTVTSGQLPTGVTLSSSGALSGTPSASGTYSFTVQAADSSSTIQKASQSLSISVAAQAGSAPTGTAPTISNVTVTSVTTNSATITWTTDIASDTMVYYGRGDNGFGYSQGILNSTSGVTTHSQTLTGLWPGRTYYFGTRSRAFSSGVPNTGLSGFYDNGSFTTAAAPTSGSFDYVWEFNGPHHVMQGYEVYVAIPTTQSQGTATRLNYTISGLPPFSAIHWPDMEAGQCCGVLSVNAPNDTEQLYSPGDTQIEIVTNMGGTTPPGTYAISVTTSAGATVGGAPTYTKTWNITVDPAQTLPQNTPASAPAIPNRSDWESNMVTYGSSFCNNAGTPGSQMSVQYYDGEKVYYNVADYTNNPGVWNACALNVRAAYRDGYVIPNNGQVAGYNRFTNGLYMDYLRTGDSVSKTAVDLMAPTGGLVNGWNITSSRIREMAYLLNAYHYDTKLGNNRTALSRQSVDMLLGDIDQIAVSGNAPWNQPFMCGLAAEALINYYEDGNQSDTRIPIAIKTIADHLWANAWGKDLNGNGFYYNSFDYSIGHPHSDMSNLNLLIAPMYAWLYRYTGDTTYLQEGDTIFSDGVVYGSGGLSYNGGKNYSQQYHWSFDYIKYRTIP